MWAGEDRGPRGLEQAGLDGSFIPSSQELGMGRGTDGLRKHLRYWIRVYISVNGVSFSEILITHHIINSFLFHSNTLTQNHFKTSFTPFYSRIKHLSKCSSPPQPSHSSSRLYPSSLPAAASPAVPPSPSTAAPRSSSTLAPRPALRAASL